MLCFLNILSCIFQHLEWKKVQLQSFKPKDTNVGRFLAQCGLQASSDHMNLPDLTNSPNSSDISNFPSFCNEYGIERLFGLEKSRIKLFKGKCYEFIMIGGQAFQFGSDLAHLSKVLAACFSLDLMIEWKKSRMSGLLHHNIHNVLLQIQKCRYIK